MADPNLVADLLAAPLEEVLVALASGVGRAQAELDRHALDTQRRILEDPLLSQLGIEATWYQIPRAELELKMTVAMETLTTTTSEGEAGKLRRLWAQPLNPRLTNQFSVDTTAASTVTLSIVAVPPPAAAAAPPELTRDQVLAIARPKLLPGPDGAPLGRVSVNFNGPLRAWFVVQTEEQQGTTAMKTMLKIDDESGTIVQQTGGV